MKKPKGNKRILFVGLNTVDLQFLVQQYPEPNTKTKASHHDFFVGGPATNAAITSAFLGSKTDLCTPVGKHIFSDFILKDITDHNITLIDPIADDLGKPVFASVITEQLNGDRTIISYHPEIKLTILSDLNIVLNDYSLIMFDGFYPDLALRIARQARENKIITLLDGGSWKPGMEDLLAYINIAICSNDFQVPDGPGHKQVFRFLQGKGISDIAITRGEKSILYLHDDLHREIDIPKVNVFDTLGAGDVLHGAFCHFYNSGNDFITSLREAGTIASKSCGYFGTREWMNTSKKGGKIYSGN